MRCATACLCLLGWTAASLPAAAAQPLALTNVNQIRALSSEVAGQHLPVRLSGVVIGEAEPDGRAFVLWADGASLYLLGRTELVSRLKRGDYIQVEGRTDPGGYAPIVLLDKVNPLGQAEIPRPTSVTYDQLTDGHLDGQWVAIAGVVRSCEPMAGQQWKTKMILETGGRRLPVQIDNHHEPLAYMDAEVLLQGICFYRYNESRQALGPSLLMPRGVPVSVIKAASQDPYAAPIVPISGLMRFTPGSSYSHRVHVRGVVTYARVGGPLWIRGNGRALRVESDQPQQLRVGEEVDVLGFADYGGYTPILEDAVFRKNGFTSPPLPVRLVDFPSTWQHDADLVQLDAELREVRRTPNGWALVVDWKDSSIDALLRWPKSVPFSEAWEVGSRLRITGICSVVTAVTGPVSGLCEPRSFEILVRSPADVVMLSPPPWWTPRRVISVLGILMAALLLAIVGIWWTARRHARQQSLQRAQAEAEFAAVMAERNRIAREIHDTLTQGLGAISLNLELVKSKLHSVGNGAATHLEIARQLVRDNLAEARNSIWQMRSQVLENGTLATALEGILNQHAAGTPLQISMETSGPMQRLSPAVENDILRVGQEAIGNAFKHANAKRVDVRLAFDRRQVRLTVHDDGCGFDVGHPPASEGGFGLTCMRERAAHLQGELQVRSEPGRGTEVCLTVPIFSVKKHER